MFSKRVLARLPACKTDLRDIQFRILSLDLLDEGEIEFNRCCKIITEGRAGHHLRPTNIKFSGLA
jgi:hypothetical protein